MVASTLLSMLGFVGGIWGNYMLEDDYTAESFFSMFNFFTDADPTNGYVDFLDASSATSRGIINVNNGTVYIGVDSTNLASGRGRGSVRVTSKASYNDSLFLLDLDHMPGNACGSWPAFWTTGPDWPNDGEIDIIEGVNAQVGNSMALHTSAGCSITDTGTFSGQIKTSNCDVKAAGQANNVGCSITTSQNNSFGDSFNAVHGGVYATEWNSSAISIWFFPRSTVPSDISSGTPDPAGWGTTLATFSGPCVIDNFFHSQQLVFDTTFCGGWAGGIWATDPTCSAKAATCQDYVQNNPSAFEQSYWSILGLKVYSLSGSSSPSLESVSLPVSTPRQSFPTTQVNGTGSGLRAWSNRQTVPSAWAIQSGNPEPWTASVVTQSEQGTARLPSPIPEADSFANGSVVSATMPLTTSSPKLVSANSSRDEVTNVPSVPDSIMNDESRAVHPGTANLSMTLWAASGKDATTRYMRMSAGGYNAFVQEDKVRAPQVDGEVRSHMLDRDRQCAGRHDTQSLCTSRPPFVPR